MILVETTLYKAAVIISFIANMAEPEIREEKRLTLGDRFLDRLECVEKIQHFLQAVPDHLITERSVRIEGQACYPLKIKYYVSPPIPLLNGVFVTRPLPEQGKQRNILSIVVP